MKLRIKGNTLRLRLTQSEADTIAQGETVKESVTFGPSGTFYYALTPSPDVEQIEAQYDDHCISILIPQEQSEQWAASDQVGIERDIPLQQGISLYVLIEKDFQCLHQRPREDEQDNFPNPAATQNT